ncbi:TPA: CRISPR-associated endonuclease Cas3'' [Yersinia enterocolitica]
MLPVAHVKLNADGQWAESHRLDEHLRCVSTFATHFSTNSMHGWAALAGRWHDLGKYRPPFQSYIRDKSGFESESAHIEQQTGRVTHSTAGALHAINTLGAGCGHMLAYLIAGHHAGLPDWSGGNGSLQMRLAQAQQEYTGAISAQVPADILTADDQRLINPTLTPESVALWLRMLFSCLVDADYLDTERYMAPDKFAARGDYPTLSELHERYRDFMAGLAARTPSTQLQQIRADILTQTLAAATGTPGIFSLTVPTGGGKTLASLGFALEHALKHGKKRIIYAIPFTSIIEQNAAVFRKVLGEDSVLEHHCSLDDDGNVYRRLATENWDAAVIVTTNVQLFESLHASRTGRCRKLHNLTDSIIILDEAQQLPRDFHRPITNTMAQLSELFGVTWVLCTATQPVLAESRDPFGRLLMPGLRNVREIIANPAHLAQQLKRVKVIFSAEAMSWQQIADELIEEECVLCIVNTRRHAREFFNLLPDDGNRIHLSAHMCAAHRSQVITEIRQRLEARRQGDKRPLRVISTQLVEAGVDLDFPAVFRAMAGLDAIAQAAGRCNREGLMGILGHVRVFMPAESAPVGLLRQAEQCTLAMLKAGLLSEPLSPKTLEQYFMRLNSQGDRDKHKICEKLTAKCSPDAPLAIQFREAAESFRLIDDKGVAVIVPYCPAGQDESPIAMLINTLESDPTAKWVYRKLQRYSVTLPESLAKALQAIGALQVCAGQMVLLESHYHPCWGVELPDTLLSAERSVI